MIGVPCESHNFAVRDLSRVEKLLANHVLLYFCL